MTDRQAAEAQIADLHLEWTFGWEQEPDSPQFDFEERFGHLYDRGEGTVYYDDFDPQHRTFTSAADYGRTWQESFRSLRSARHGIAELPRVVAGDELASSWGVFVARIEPRGAEPLYLRTTSSLLWRRGDRWRIARDLTSSQILDRASFEEQWASAVHIRTPDLDG